MGGIFRTFRNTWNITKTSAVVLRKDKELLLFPVMSFIGVAIIVGIAAAIFATTGAFDRLNTTGEGSEFQTPDVIIGVLALVAALFVINYFNAALMGAARHRLKGGDPNLGTGFAAVNKHIGAVFGWTVISAIILIVLTYLRGKTNSFLGRILIGMIGAVWAYMTFFVVPILIIEGVGPIEAIKRSSGYFKQTWGEQLVSGFGFGIIRFVAILPGVILGGAIGSISPIAGIIVAIPLVTLGLAVVNGLEGVFKMALYIQVVEGVEPQFFDKHLLQTAYVPGGTSAYRGGRF